MVRSRGGDRPPLMKLFGSEPPSRLIEEIYMEPRSSYRFEKTDGTIILKAPYGSSYFMNLCVNERDLSSAIAELARTEV